MCEDIALKNANLDKIRHYPIMGTIVPGLEKIVGSQIKDLFPDCVITDTQRGKVFFEVNASLKQLLKIKCMDNLYYFIAVIPSGTTKDGIKQLALNIRKLPFLSFIPFFCEIGRHVPIHVTASRSGKHSFSRIYVADMVLETLSSLDYFSKGNAGYHDLHFRLDVIDKVTYVSLKITSASFRYRGDRRNFMPGAIRPSIANTMVWLSCPGQRDVTLDPFCGSGTIVSEREYYPYHKILGFDIEQEAVEVAKSNVSPNVIIRQGDARNLPLSSHSVDSIITNAPWDVQIHAGDICKLYSAFLKEAKRLLKEEGRCILLTDKTEIVGRVCFELGLAVKQLAQLSLHGLHPCVFQLSKL